MTVTLTSHEVLEAAAAWFATKHGIGEPYSWSFKRLGGEQLELELTRVANVVRLREPAGR